MIVLTGGAGFIGSNVLRKLNWQGINDIIVVDDLSNGAKMQALARSKFADYFDFREFLTESKKLKNITNVIHLGAISDTRFENGRVLTAQNFTFSKEMLALATEHRCPFTYASSASVYGSRKKDFIESPQYEDPQTPYAISKRMFDEYVRKMTGISGGGVGGVGAGPVIGLRYFNVYGPGEELKGNMASFPYKCLVKMARGEKIELFEDSDENVTPPARDFIHIDDVVMATLFFSVWVQNNSQTGIYNIGTGTATSFRRVAELAGATEANLEVKPLPEFMRNAYQNFTQADLNKLYDSGYKYGMHTIESGMRSYKNYLETQPCLKHSL